MKKIRKSLLGFLATVLFATSIGIGVGMETSLYKADEVLAAPTSGYTKRNVVTGKNHIYVKSAAMSGGNYKISGWGALEKTAHFTRNTHTYYLVFKNTKDSKDVYRTGNVNPTTAQGNKNSVFDFDYYPTRPRCSTGAYTLNGVSSCNYNMTHVSFDFSIPISTLESKLKVDAEYDLYLGINIKAAESYYEIPVFAHQHSNKTNQGTGSVKTVMDYNLGVSQSTKLKPNVSEGRIRRTAPSGAIIGTLNINTTYTPLSSAVHSNTVWYQVQSNGWSAQTLFNIGGKPASIKLKGKPYSVTYHPNGGSGSSVKKAATYGKNYKTENNLFSRSGYTFKGWSTSSTGGVNSTWTNRIGKNWTWNQSSNQNLYAVWEQNKARITYNPNGGSAVSPTYKDIAHNGTYGSFPSTSRTGYTLNGWYSAASGGTKLATSTKIRSNSAHTIYAQWSAKKFTASFNANGGSTANPSSKTVTYDKAIGTLPTTSRTGYTLRGWYTATSGGTKITDKTVYKTNGNSTYYAQWDAKEFTVTFNPNGGTAPNPSSKKVKFDGTYGALPTTSRKGHTFTGWNTKQDGTGTTVTSSTVYKVNGNQTLYAQWKVNEYNLTYDPNGANGNKITNKIKFNTNFTVLNKRPNDFVKNGYYFTGWNSNKNGGSSTNYELGSIHKYTDDFNKTLYAQWKEYGSVPGDLYNFGVQAFDKYFKVGELDSSTTLNNLLKDIRLVDEIANATVLNASNNFKPKAGDTFVLNTSDVNNVKNNTDKEGVYTVRYTYTTKINNVFEGNFDVYILDIPVETKVRFIPNSESESFNESILNLDSNKLKDLLSNREPLRTIEFDVKKGE